MRALFLPTVALACSLSLTSGCANDTSRARESARVFLSAANRGDSAAMLPVTTRAAHPYVAKITPESLSSKASFTLQNAIIVKNNQAEVPFITQGDDSKTYSGAVFLRYEEKEWRVWGIRTQLTNGGELMLNLEHPEQMAGALLGVAFGELAKRLENTGKDADKSGRALGEAVSGFMRSFSESLEKTTSKTAPEDALSPPVVR